MKAIKFDFYDVIDDDDEIILGQTYETTFRGAVWEDIWDDFVSNHFYSIEGKYGHIETGGSEFDSREIEKSVRQDCLNEISETLKLYDIHCGDWVKTYDRT